MSHKLSFGETVEGFDIPVLNEREIRAAAGILFLMVFISVMFVAFTDNFTPLKFAISIFLIDISIRVFLSPRYAPTLILGRLIVRNQVPEYVGAKQKKFAWIIGVVLASIFFVHMVILNAFSPITGLVCLACLLFLFFETAFGICLGCKFYPLFHKEKLQYCPGEVCTVDQKQPIQKTSFDQLAVVFLFVVAMVVGVVLLKDIYSEQPIDLFGLTTGTQSAGN